MASRFGLSVALATPFHASGQIAVPAMVAQAKACLGAGCSSVTLFGTTGEGASVGTEERRKVIEAMLAAGIPPHQLVAGVLVDAAEDAAEQAGHALAARRPQHPSGSAILFQECRRRRRLSAGFQPSSPASADRLEISSLYNIPSVTMVTLSRQPHRPAADRLSRRRHRGQGFRRRLELTPKRCLKAHGDLVILIGDERHLAKGVRLGGQGAISGMANFVPAKSAAMAEDGRDDARVEDFVLELLKFPVTPAVKVMVARKTGDESWLAVRPPLVPIAAQEQAAACSLPSTGYFATEPA